MKKRTLLSILLAALCCACCIFAACKAKISVTLEANGGNVPAQVEVVKGETFELPVPTKDGYTFEGWYLTADFSGDKITSIKVEKECTLYAKWAQYATINFELNGGTLSVGSVNALVGSKIKEVVSAYVPQITLSEGEGKFLAWYIGSRQLTDTAALAVGGVTLTAKYQYKYTIEIKVQELGGSDYVKTGEYPTIEGYAAEGETIAAPSYDGLTAVKDTTAMKIVKGKNEFTVNYDRKNLSVTFDHNLPSGAENTTRQNVKFGETVDALTGLTADGYLLVGWSTEKNGAVVYSVDSISDKLYRGGEVTAPDTIKPVKNMTLYAKWAKGLTNMFGGSDVIYLFDTADGEKDVYLYRGGYFFKGAYAKRTESIKFTVDEESDDIREAYVINETSFAYRNNERKQTYYEYGIVFDNGRLSSNVNKDTKLEFDEGSSFTYTVAVEGETTKTSKGYYVIENGEYKLAFNEGELNGKTQHCVVETLGGENVFWFRNEKEYGQKLLRYQVMNGDIKAIPESYGYYLLLNGYSVAYMVVSGQTQGFYYDFNGEFIDLYSSQGLKQGTFKIIEIDGVKGYTAYSSALAQTFMNGVETLALDGSYNATYKDKNGATYNGVFVQSGTSVFGGVIIDFHYGNGLKKTFVLTATQTKNDNGETETKYSFAEKADGYAEYYFVQGSKIYKTPLFVVNESQEGELVVYAMTESKTYAKVAYGTYEQNKDGTYTFKDIILCEVDNLVKEEEYVYDFSGISSIVFEIDTKSASSPFVYWYVINKADGNADDKRVTYVDENNATTLVLTGIFATFTKEEKVYEGILSTDEDSGISVLSANGSYFYFELNEEAKTYILYQSAPYTAYAVAKNGSLTAAEYITSDGKGGATYNIVTSQKNEETGDDEDKTQTVPGTITATNEKAGSVIVYEFKSSDGSNDFTFITLVVGNYYAFAKKQGGLVGSYTAADGSTLELDGYITAKYNTADGRVFENAFYFETSVENQVLFVYSNSSSSLTAYFDLVKSDKTFTRRGTEYGTFMRLDNQGMSGMSFEFDGYGTPEDYGKTAHAKVYDYERDTNGEFLRDENGQLKPVTVDENAFYKIDTENGRTYIYVKYTVKNEEGGGSETVEVRGMLSSVTSGSSTIPVLIEVHTEVEETYIDDSDWTILITTSYGTAMHIDGKTGVSSVGSYMIIDFNEETKTGLLYFTAGGENASVYRYDANTRSITRPRYENAYSYYSEDLSALYFSKQGYVTYAKGETGITYYYDVDKDRKVILYHQNWYESGCNEYGFIAEEFGDFSDEKVWKDGTYYKTGDTKITFKRGGTAATYPVPYSDKIEKAYFGDITFIPNGKEDFSISATIALVDENGDPLFAEDGKEISPITGKVVRNSGKTYISLELSNGSKYLFDVGLAFNGAKNSIYTVTSMKLEMSGSGYKYNNAMMQAIMQMFSGGNAEELIKQAEKYNYGSFAFTVIYGEDGKESSKLLEATLTENTLLKDANGKLWKFDGETSRTTNEDGKTVVVVEGDDAFEKTSAGYKLKLSDEKGNNKYTAIVAFQSLQYFSGVGFYFSAINVVSELTASYNGTTYTATVERVIDTERTDVTLGSVYAVELTDNEGNAIDMSYGYYGFAYDKDTGKAITDRNTLWYISRTKNEDSDKFEAASKIFYLEFKATDKVIDSTPSTSEDEGAVDDENKETKTVYAAYESFTVICYEAKVIYNSDGTEYIDFIPGDTAAEGKIVMRTRSNGSYVVYECEYDAEKGGYSVTQANGTKLLIKIQTREDGTEYYTFEN